MATLLIFSCKKQDSFTSGKFDQDLNSTPSGGYDYELKYDSVLKAATYGLIDILPQFSYRQIINSEVSKQFDGDENALFRELNTAFSNSSLNLQTLMQNSCNAHGYGGYSYLIPDVLGGFKYFNDTVYPQLYIPFYSSYNINAAHSVCYNLDDEAVLPGFTYVGGSLSSMNITESFAQENSTYVASANEVVNNAGEVSVHNSTVRSRGNDLLALFVNKFKVSTKNEKWGNGRAEVENIVRLFKPSNCNDITSFYGFKNKVGSNRLNTWIDPENREDIFYDPYWWGTNDAAFIVLYEKDVRRKFQKSVNVPGCGNLSLNYVSRENLYGSHMPERFDYSWTGRPVEIDVSLGNNNFITLQSIWFEEQ